MQTHSLGSKVQFYILKIPDFSWIEHLASSVPDVSMQLSSPKGEARTVPITGMRKAPIIFVEYFGWPRATSMAGKDCIFLRSVSVNRIESTRVGSSDPLRSLPISAGVQT
jgi:hypothetical protein